MGELQRLLLEARQLSLPIAKKIGIRLCQRAPPS